MARIIFTDARGVGYTESQVACALQASRFLCDAYQEGESGSEVKWEDVDQAHEIALEAFSVPPQYEFKRAEDTEGGSCD